MTGDDAALVRRVFADALEVEGDARQRLLDESCAGRPDIRARVEALLRASSVVGGFLDGPTMASAAPPGGPGSDAGQTEPLGSVIGPYTLRRLLGRGGFGEVYAAEQLRPIRRMVALKIIRQGMDTRAVIARFEAERQALAMMSHPNIASVLDAGSTPTGRPYFVMELVSGDPMTTYCDQRRLPIDERLSIFLQVCRAVQHAHQKGIIHRDLKPSNVLVSAGEDGGHIVKVIDFGIAKATQARDAEHAAFTEHRQLIGTPEYMSPEQADGALDIDTRSDVYSLGVLLYELLAGTTPIDARTLRSAAYGEMQRLIREMEPPAPSSRLSESREILPGLAANRQVEPARLPSIVRGELDWIVMRTLEKERTRRYDSVGNLAADIERFLSHEPVEAAPPSTAYRLRKLVRRHRVGVAVAAALVAALTLGAIGTTIGLLRARQALQESRAEQARATAISGFMDETFRGVTPAVARGRDGQLLRDMMRSASARLDAGQLRRNPRAEVELRVTIADVFASLADQDQARTQRQAAVDLARRALGEDDPLTRRALLGLAQSLNEAQDPTRSLELLDAVIKGETAPVDPTVLITAHVVRSFGLYLRQGGWTAEAEDAARTAVRLAKERDPEGNTLLLQPLLQLARMLAAGGKPREAERTFREAVELATRRHGADHPETIEARGLLAEQLSLADATEEADSLIRDIVEQTTRLYGPDHPAVAAARFRLSMLLRSRHEFAKAAEQDELVVAIRRKALGSMHRDVATALVMLARNRASLGDCAGAETAAREALTIREAIAGPRSPVVASSLADLGRIEICLGRLDEALATLKRSDAIWAEIDPRNGHRLEPMTDLADVLQQRGDFAGAAERYTAALDLGLAHAPMLRLQLAHNLAGIASNLAARGSREPAAEAARRAMAVLRAESSEPSPLAVQIMAGASLALAQSGGCDEARPLARERLSVVQRLEKPPGLETTSAMEALGQILRACGDMQGSLETLRRAAELHRTIEPDSPGEWWARGLVGVTLSAIARQKNAPDDAWRQADEQLKQAHAALSSPTMPVGRVPPEQIAHLARALAELHAAWHAIEPGAGHDEESKRWRELRR